MYPKKVGVNRWIIEVRGKSGKDEELYITLPPSAIDQMGWAEGDAIEWIDNKDGTWELKKVE